MTGVDFVDAAGEHVVVDQAEAAEQPIAGGNQGRGCRGRPAVYGVQCSALTRLSHASTAASSG